MEIYFLVDTATNLPLRLSYTKETEGQAYHTWEVPSFDLEFSHEYNQNSPVWTTSNKSLAEAMIVKHQDKTLKTLTENIDNPNCYLFTEGIIEIKTVTL